MHDDVKNAYELLGFTTEKPTESGTYIAVCMESDYQPYVIAVDMYQGLISDDCIGSNPIDAYHYNLTDLMYKFIVGYK